MKHKKIAFVSNTSWSLYNFRLGVMRELKARGATVLAIAPKDNFSAELVAEGFTFIDLKLRNYSTNPFSDLFTLSNFIQIYRKQRPDFIFHYTIKPNIYGSIAAAVCRIPSIAITTGLGHLFTYKNPIVQSISIGLYRIGAKLSKQVWFLNEEDRQTFLDKKIVRPEKAFLLKSEGINIRRFSIEGWQSSRGKNKLSTFLFAGRVIWDKGVREYVEAAKIIKQRYPQTRFQILGFVDPSNHNYVPYEQISAWQQAGIIEYLGETTDVRPFLAEADALVFPSFYREGISRILLEAASMSLPIITTDNVGCREVVEDGRNGFLCRPQDVMDLVQGIERFIQLSQREKDVMGLRGRKKVIEEFDEGIVIRKYLNELQQYIIKDQQISKKIKVTTSNADRLD